jgi:putative flippase GtrA
VQSPQRLAARVGSTWRLLLKELSAFGVVGIVCTVIDVGLFHLMYATLGVGAVTAKVLSTVAGMTVAYFGHRYWSFSHRARTNPRREYLLFALINGGTLLLGAAIVAVVRYPLGQDGVLIVQIANIGSIVLCTVVRYLAYRTWVFPAVAPGGDGQPENSDADELRAQAHVVA